MAKTREEIQQMAKSDNLDDIKQAEAAIRQFISEFPNDMEAKLVLGQCLGRQSKSEEAIELFEALLAQEPSNAKATYYLGLTHEFAEKQDKAIEMYKRLQNTQEYGAIVSYRLGKIYVDHSSKHYDLQVARMYFVKATKHEKPVEGAFVELATIEKGKRATYVLQSGLKAFPDSSLIYTRLSSHYLHSLGDNDACLRIALQALEKGIDTNDLRFDLALAYSNLGKYENAIEQIGNIKERQYDVKDELSLLSAVFLLEKGDLDEAENILVSLISTDFANHLDFVAHFIAICCFFRKKNFRKAESTFDEIPDEKEFYDFSLTVVPFGEYRLSKYFDEALEGIFSHSKNEANIAKAHGIRALAKRYETSHEDDLEWWKETHEEIEGVLKFFPQSSVYHNLMGEVLEHLSKPVDAIQHYITAQLTTDKQLWIELQHSLEKVYPDKKALHALFDWFEKELDRYYYGKDHIAGELLEQIVSFFHSAHEYEWVIRLCKNFSYEHLLAADVLFELAYSYSEIGNKRKSRQYYEAYIKDKGPSSAALNNLSLIYEQNGDLGKSESLLKQALDIEHEDEIAQKNLERIQQNIQQEEKQKRAYEKAAKLYLQESALTRKAIALLYESRLSESQKRLERVNRDGHGSSIGNFNGTAQEGREAGQAKSTDLQAKGSPAKGAGAETAKKDPEIDQQECQS